MLRTPLVLSKTRLESLTEVCNLNLWGNELTDVTLLSSMPNLEIISLSINQLTTLSYFANCSKLKEIYLRKNHITDICEIVHLQGLRALHTLWLSDNPCANATTEEGPWYRSFILRMLPQLRKLDNIVITSEERADALATNNAVLHAMHKRAQHLATRASSNGGMNLNDSTSFHSPSRNNNSNFNARDTRSGLQKTFDVNDRSYIHMEGRDLNVAERMDASPSPIRSPNHNNGTAQGNSSFNNIVRGNPSSTPLSNTRNVVNVSVKAPSNLSPRSLDVNKMIDIRESQTNPLDNLGRGEDNVRSVRKKQSELPIVMKNKTEERRKGNGDRYVQENQGARNNKSEIDSSSAVDVVLLLLSKMNTNDLKKVSEECNLLLRRK